MVKQMRRMQRPMGFRSRRLPGFGRGRIATLLMLFWLSRGYASSLLSADGGATVQGDVKDGSGALIPGADVELKAIGGTGDWTTVTGDLGTFEFTVTTAGSFALTVECPGFQEYHLEPVELTAGETRHVEVVLKLAEISEHAEVVAERSPEGGGRKLEPVIHPIGMPPFMIPEKPKPPLRVRGRISSDWYGIHTQVGMVNQLSNRARMVIGEPGTGWNLQLDLRDRLTIGESSHHLLSVYDARLVYDDSNRPFYLAVGQMNLYDTAGIGELLGAMGGYRPKRNLLVGGYAGLRPDLYGTGLDAGFQKFGVFARYFGPRARSFSVSYNELLYSGKSERRFIYLNGLSPVGERAVFYGNLEFELGRNIQAADRLSRLFLNGRVDFLRDFDVIASFSSGKGLDFHRFLLEHGADPLGSFSELERFYYNLQYGARLRYRIRNGWRVYVGERVSERKDQSIRNYTTQLGISTGQLAETGVSLYANYNLNRGDTSESNSLYLSVSKTLGRHSWNTSYSTSFNGLRFNSTAGFPEVVHVASRHTLFNELFLVISRALAVSLQHEHTFGQLQGEDLFFVRFMFRM